MRGKNRCTWTPDSDGKGQKACGVYCKDKELYSGDKDKETKCKQDSNAFWERKSKTCYKAYSSSSQCKTDQCSSCIGEYCGDAADGDTCTPTQNCMAIRDGGLENICSHFGLFNIVALSGTTDCGCNRCYPAKFCKGVKVKKESGNVQGRAIHGKRLHVQQKRES